MEMIAPDDMPYSTPEERKKVYIRVISIYIADNLQWLYGICEIIDTLCGNSENPLIIDIENIFPEIEAQRPQNYRGSYWWPLDVKQPRIDALNKAIELCNTAMQQQPSVDESTQS